MRTSIRHPHRHQLGIVALGAAGLLLAGCSGTATTSTEPPASSAPAPTASAAASPAALAWTGSVCTALDPLLTTITSPPQLDLGDAAAAKQAYSSYLGTAIAQANQARKQVADAGTPPVSDQVSQRVQEQLAQLGTKLSQTQTEVDQANLNDPAAITQAVGAAGGVIGSLGDSAQTLAAVRNDSQLAPAFDQTPSCEQLRTLGPS